MSLIWRKIVSIYRWVNRKIRTFIYCIVAILLLLGLILAGGKTYQHLDRDASRGAIAIDSGAFNENYTTPIYLDQGWDESDSLWFYNTTQGSNLLPYDFFIALEQVNSTQLLRSDASMDALRYLPQKKTFFNPDALPVGFVKDNYDGNDYIGLTCAACHTGQVNYKGQAIRIDGGPSMADMSGFLSALEAALKQTRLDDAKRARFVKAVLALKNDYKRESKVIDDLDLWLKIRQQYNIVNHSKVDYGYARLDAFGRIYNRVLQYAIDRDQLERQLLAVRNGAGRRLLQVDQVKKALEGVDDSIIGRDALIMIIERLMSTESGASGLGLKDMLYIRDAIFNEPNAPVSYPFLWDTTKSDFVQWNGIAGNAGAGPLGRNVGEVMGVFASLDWTLYRPWYLKIDIPARVSGQVNKQKIIDFKSSVNAVNLQRLEAHLSRLTSPVWPQDILGEIDEALAEEGERLYEEYCSSCHEIIDRNDWSRLVIAQMSGIDKVQTDPAMAENSVLYSGGSGNFKHTYQKRDVGNIIIEGKAPAAVILTSATRGVVATPDADKNIIRRSLDWLYVMAMSFFQNDIKESIRNGDYSSDTTSKPFDSLLSYKARPLNGIWATAPYLHNGSVPTLYDLLLPVKREGDPEEGKYRPDEFIVGSREFDPIRIGFKSQGYDGFKYTTERRGNFNTGHEYAAGRTPRSDGKILQALDESERWALVEYLKTL